MYNVRKAYLKSIGILFTAVVAKERFSLYLLCTADISKLL